MSLVDARARRQLRDVLLPAERVVVATHEHWARWLSLLGGVVTAFLLAFMIDALAPLEWGGLVNFCWLLALLLLPYSLWQIFSFRFDWFVATDKRLILRRGVFFRSTAMMPMSKVTDMSFLRSPAARMLGYGTFVMESAGQDQALREIEWVPRPQEVYRLLCSEIFATRDPDDEPSPTPDPRLLGLSDDPDITNPGIAPPQFAPVRVRTRTSTASAGTPASTPTASPTSAPTSAAVAPPRRRSAPAKDSLRQRILRGPQPMETHEFSDEVQRANPGWAVSREDAPPRQDVKPAEPWWDRWSRPDDEGPRD